MNIFHSIAAYLLVFPVFILSGQDSGPAVITAADTVHHRVGPQFFGLQYHPHTFPDQTARDLLQPLNVSLIRIWAEINDFHPAPGVWLWEELDEKLDEIRAAGYEPVPCLWGEEWFTGTEDSAWWNYSAALAEWDSAASRLAARYREQIRRIILFDELNMLYPDQPYYITFQDAARLYIRAAGMIKDVDPSLLTGGPSGFGGWENGHWASSVFNEDNGSQYLDFISSNTFLSWDPLEPDQQVMAKTIWYEEVPLKIRAMLNGRVCPELMLDAYNLSALWQVNGELWTDPRNTSVLGGVYQAAALLHSAKGGFDITLHWETLGGFGILSWYPEFTALPPYYSWKLLTEIAGVVEGAEIIGCVTSEKPKSDVLHHGGMNVDLYDLQPFAVRRPDGGVSFILINKQVCDTIPVSVKLPPDMNLYSLYRFDAARMHDTCQPLEEAAQERVVAYSCPPLSVTVIRCEGHDRSGIQEYSDGEERGYLLTQNFPNPFNSETSIGFRIKTFSRVRISIFDMQGRKIQTVTDRNFPAGAHAVSYQASHLPSGVYFYRMTADRFTSVRKFTVLN